MKIIYILVVVAFLGMSASVALADGADPIVFTRGCGGSGQPACDAGLITGTAGNFSANFTATFSCSPTADASTCFATEDLINLTGATINAFNLALNPVSVMGIPLTFSCETGGFFVCTQNSALSFTFSGGANSLCSTDSNDLSPIAGQPGQYSFNPDGDADDTCSGITIGMQGVTGEPNLNGVTVTGSVSTPEPSSALLLLFGLMAGLVSFKTLRSTLS
ncbi:MAG TPA: PEP-CTERM sorting domain-containing protein [Candidatus Sulfotelmatobacter sp.]|nr:PEP-CTERM sorting domain-containing protein [Candidatus Sulfotelmatobacter sp.]